MQQFRLFLLLLTPSPLGAVLTFLAAIIIPLSANWTYTVNNSFLSDFLYGDSGIITQFSGSTDKISVYASTFSTQYLTYEIVVFIAALIIGFFVYIVLQIVSGSIRSFGGIADQIRGTRGRDQLDIKLSVGLHLTIRIVALILWFCFWTLTVKILLPYSILATQLTVEDIFTSLDWLYGILGILVMAFTIHMHVIFARLVMLRPRLFGGSEAIELAMLDE